MRKDIHSDHLKSLAAKLKKNFLTVYQPIPMAQAYIEKFFNDHGEDVSLEDIACLAYDLGLSRIVFQIEPMSIKNIGTELDSGEI